MANSHVLGSMGTVLWRRPGYQEARRLKERKICCFGQWVRPGFGFEKLD